MSAIGCQNCGAQLKAGATRCLKCGTTVAIAPPPPQPVAAAQVPPAQAPVGQPQVIYVQAPANVPAKSKVAAALLAFFLGFLGIHNFYLGYSGRGIAQLLLTVLTCGYGIVFTGIWAFIEFVLILTGTLKDPYGRDLV